MLLFCFINIFYYICSMKTLIIQIVLVVFSMLVGYLAVLIPKVIEIGMVAVVLIKRKQVIRVSLVVLLFLELLTLLIKVLNSIQG